MKAGAHDCAYNSALFTLLPLLKQNRFICMLPMMLRNGGGPGGVQHGVMGMVIRDLMIIMRTVKTLLNRTMRSSQSSLFHDHGQ